MEDNAINPLFNPLVIKEVYKYLRFHDKKSFRLVCKIWVDTILNLWRKQTKLVIKQTVYSQGRLNTRLETADFILKYSNLYKIEEKPLLNLGLVNLEFSFLPDDFLKKAQKEFLNISVIQNVQNLLSIHFGHSLERLELLRCSFLQDGQKEVGFYHILLNSFPKLKVLSVRHPTITPSFGHAFTVDKSSFARTQSDLSTLNLEASMIAATFERILNLIPNLKNLSLQRTSWDVLRVLSSPLTSSGSHILLDRLGIDVDISLIYMIPALIKNYLEAARPPLKCLKASLPFGKLPLSEWFGLEIPDEAIIYKEICNCVGNTLTSLNLKILTGECRWITILTGCFLPKLTNLCINFRPTNSDVVELLCFDFGMLRGIPLLQKLHLEFEALYSKSIPKIGTNLKEHELEWTSSSEPIVLKHMEDFRFELYHKPTEGCWKAFARMMPNLQKLQGMVDEDSDPLVRQLWPDLDLKWSTLLKQVDRMRQDGQLLKGIVIFGNGWQEGDWENWEGKRDSIYV